MTLEPTYALQHGRQVQVTRQHRRNGMLSKTGDCHSRLTHLQFNSSPQLDAEPANFLTSLKKLQKQAIDLKPTED